MAGYKITPVEGTDRYLFEMDLDEETHAALERLRELLPECNDEEIFAQVVRHARETLEKGAPSTPFLLR